MSRKKKLPTNIPVPDMSKGARGFFGDVMTEMKRVIWPTRQDLIRLTTMVVLVCAVFVLYLFAFERVVDMIVSLLLGKGGVK